MCVYIYVRCLLTVVFHLYICIIHIYIFMYTYIFPDGNLPI